MLRDPAKPLAPHLPFVLLLVAVVCAVYGGVLGHDFIPNWDDNEYVIANAAIRGISPANLKAAFTRFYAGNYAPLQIVSYMADYLLWGLKPWGFLLTNVILHALNGVLFYGLLVRLDGEKVRAFFASFIFLCHPVQVESVAWVSQRKNVLAMFFFLVACWCYIRYREEEGRPAGVFYAGSFLAFAGALLTKAVTVVLPLVLVLYDLCYGTSQTARKRIADKVPYLVAAAIVALLTYRSQSLESGGGRVGYHGGGPAATMLTMTTVFARYLAMFVWPTRLSAAYSPPIKTGIDSAVALAVLILILAAVGGVVLYRKQRRLFFWYGLFWIGLLPVSQIIPIATLMNDRYLYFPMLGAAPLVTGVGSLLVGKLHRQWRQVAAGVLSLLVMPLPFLAWGQTRVWHDSVSLWGDAVHNSPRSLVAWLHYGAALESADRTAEAYSAYLRAVARRPKVFGPSGENARGSKKRVDQGELLYYADALGCLGSLKLRENSTDEAAGWYLQALSTNPLTKDALKGLGIIYTRMNQPEAGRLYLERLTDAFPEEPAGFQLLAENRSVAGDSAGAERNFYKVLSLDPASPRAARGLGDIFLARGDGSRAAEWYGKELKMGGDRGGAEFGLARAYSLTGQYSEAALHLVTALQSGFRARKEITGSRELAPLLDYPAVKEMLNRQSGP